MKLVNEDIIFDVNNCFAHSEWIKLFKEEERLPHEVVDKWCKEFELQRVRFEFDGEEDEHEDIRDASSPLEIWPLEMDLKEDVLLGYYETEDGYIQVWAVDKETL